MFLHLGLTPSELGRAKTGQLAQLDAWPPSLMHN
jgi:hypothetical protein